jgi:tellurite resistance-related uncharacterized protein
MAEERIAPATAQQPASSFPRGLVAYKRTAEYTEASVPRGLLNAHSTKDGVWGRICVTSEQLVYCVKDPRRVPHEQILWPGIDGIVEPTILHEVRPNGSVTFTVEFMRMPVEK